MKKYHDEYFSVLNKKTGKKLLDCGDEQDALAMVSMDPENRTYTRNKFLMGPVVDVEIPKALPTNEIVVNMDGGVGGSAADQGEGRIGEGAGDAEAREGGADGADQERLSGLGDPPRNAVTDDERLSIRAGERADGEVGDATALGADRKRCSRGRTGAGCVSGSEGARE